MGTNGHFTEEEKAMIREIAREILKEAQPQLADAIELKAWRGLGKLVAATGIISSVTTLAGKALWESLRK